MAWVVNAQRTKPAGTAHVSDDRRQRLAALRSSNPTQFLAHMPMMAAAIVTEGAGADGNPVAVTPTAAEAQALATSVIDPAKAQQRAERKAQRKAEKQFSSQVAISNTVLGSGSFGVVYLGVHKQTGAYVAVKKLAIRPKSTAVDGTAVKSQLDDIVEEIRLMKVLEHRNIVRYLSAEHTASELTIYMEYMSGGTLTSMLKKFDVVPEAMLRVYLSQAIEGVAYLHMRNIVHRDIKADNILLSSDGTAKLSDFGTSREFSDSANLLTITGTPWFMAPEVVKGTGHGSAADIWSIGCTMIQLVRGAAPFSEFPNPVTAMYHVALNPAKVLEYIPATCTAALRQCLEWCLQENPLNRPTAAQLLQHEFFSQAQHDSEVSSDASSESEGAAASPPSQLPQSSRHAQGQNAPSAQRIITPSQGTRIPSRPTTPLSARAGRLREDTQNMQWTSAVAAQWQPPS